MEFACATVIPLLGLFLKEMKSYQKDTCTGVRITAPFAVAKMHNQPRYLLVAE